MSNFHIISNHPLLLRAVRIEFLISRDTRKLIRKIFIFLAVIFFVVWISIHFNSSSDSGLAYINYTVFICTLVLGSVSWFMIFLEFYFLSTSRPVKFLGNEEENKTYYLDFGGARRLYYLGTLDNEQIDINRMYSFLFQSNFIKILLTRLGIGKEEFTNFLHSNVAKTVIISKDKLFETLIKEANEGESQTFGAREFTMALFDLDNNFQQFLFNLHIRRAELSGGSGWAGRIMENMRKGDRWWEKELLGRVPGIWTNLGFGRTFMLDRYSSPIAGDRNSFGGKIKFIAHKNELLQIEEILSRSSQSNVLLVGERGAGRHSVLAALASFIVRGIAMPSLGNKQLINLDAVSLVANLNNKASLEAGVIKLMNEVVSAGNVVLVIDNFPEFLESSRSIGVDAMLILEPYLQGSSLQLIGISDLELFQRQLMRDGRMIKFFEKVEIKETSNKETILILEDVVPIFEYRNKILITYQAIEKVASIAETYITDGIMPEKLLTFKKFAYIMMISGSSVGVIFCPFKISLIMGSTSALAVLPGLIIFFIFYFSH